MVFKRHLQKTDLDSINIIIRDDLRVFIRTALARISPRVIIFHDTLILWLLHSLLASSYSYQYETTLRLMVPSGLCKQLILRTMDELFWDKWMNPKNNVLNSKGS